LVFDGRKGNYTEGDQPDPVLMYGKQKVEVEKYIIETCNEYVIMRFSKIFGSELGDKTLFTQWIQDIEHTDAIKCASDQVFTPIYIDDVIKSIIRLIECDENGIYHVASYKPYSRIDLLKMLISHMKKYSRMNISVIPVSINDFNLKDKRPLNVSLLPHKLVRDTGIELSNVENICEGIARKTCVSSCSK